MKEAADLVAALAWPLTVAAVVWFFRQPIGEVLRRTTGFDAFGVSLPSPNSLWILRHRDAKT